jgi:hypothetical protein
VEKKTMADDLDRAEEIRAKIKQLTDAVHELLEGPEGTGQIDRSYETVRMTLELPIAWIRLGAWLQLTSEARQSGEYRVADEGEAGNWNAERKLARLWLKTMIDEQMHEELHKLAVGAHEFSAPLPVALDVAPEIMEKARAIFDDLDKFQPAVDVYNAAVWAKDDAKAAHWQTVFKALELLWDQSGRQVTDMGEYGLLQMCAFYAAGGADQSPEELAAEAALRDLEGLEEIPPDDDDFGVPS